jgi:hypothetical protein
MQRGRDWIKHMLPLLLSAIWLIIVAAVMAVCRAGARADAATSAELPRLTRSARFPGLPGLTVWEQSDRVRLERSALASRSLQRRSRRGAHRPQRRPAACARPPRLNA